MKKLFAATVSVAALYGASAFAADMPKAYTKAPVYKAAAPGYNWTGWYGGFNVGVGVAEVHGSIDNLFPGPSDRNDVGFAGGVQAGYNWQVAPQWVVGVEGDIGYLGIKRSFADFNSVSELGVKTDWYATLRGRFGYAKGPSLFYTTGGAAFVNVRNNYDFLLTPVTFVSQSQIATGWTVGGGIETLLGGNWSAKAEYLYIDAGSQDVLNSTVTNIVNFENRFHVYRYGLNYKFGDPAMASIALPEHNWTGFYAGVNAGVGLSQGTSDVLFDLGLIAGNLADLAGLGLTGGMQAGYNWQLNPNWVVGIEGDIGYLGIKSLNNNFDNNGFVFGLRTDWYGTLRGRLGYSTGPALLYVTGGAAFVQVKNNFDSIGTASFVSTSETATGWTVGGGIEAAFAQNWTAKTEYLYIDAGHQDVLNSSIFSATPGTARFDNLFHVFRFGVNYNFNASAMAPVAARY